MRKDLLQLTPDAVIALANRGLVKRALKDIEAGRLPDITDQEDGTVVGRFDDVEATIPPDTPLRDATCTCGARTMCRHRVTLALAYAHVRGDKKEEGAEETELVVWSPAEFEDDALEKLLGKRSMSRARSLRRKGYVARVRRPTAVDATPTVELSTCTVRFLVPHELAYAQSDAADRSGREFIALAVWAFRAADDKDEASTEVEVEVAAKDIAAGGSIEGLMQALTLADELVLTGASHAGTAMGGRFERARRGLEKRGLTWCALCVDEIEEQLSAYQRRSARYRAARFADLLIELHARDRAARRGTSVPARRVLGSEESMESALDHLRLISLGARVRAFGRTRRADVLLADPDTATVLVLRKEWRYGEDEEPLNGDKLASKVVAARATLKALAKGNVVSASASRRANRLLSLKTSRVARTSVTPSAGDWDALPEPLRVVDVTKLEAAMRARPPRMIRPRVLAESVHAVQIGSVEEVRYAPGEQSLTALVRDPSENPLLVRLVHRGVAPGALDLLAHALSGDLGEPRFVSGSMRRTPRGISIEPFAVAADALHVLDLAPEETRHTMEVDAVEDTGGPVPAALRRAAELLEEGAHRGLRHASPSYAARVAEAAATLRRVGLSKAADRLAPVGPALSSALTSGGDDLEAFAARAWIDARLRIRLTEEAL